MTHTRKHFKIGAGLLIAGITLAITAPPTFPLVLLTLAVAAWTMEMRSRT